ncbi:MAG TPA: hypothetical protein PKV67_13800 [Hyphomonas sp.]|nr:hypothetical protein [Hyphomonas sp.]HRK69240.1 hypothetical protein [Hyphomonas sp.]
MTARLMTPYCFAAEAVRALIADSRFTLRLLETFAVPARTQAPVFPLDPVGGLGAAALEQAVESWNQAEAG